MIIEKIISQGLRERIASRRDSESNSTQILRERITPHRDSEIS